jgi:antitoxin Phd
MDLKEVDKMNINTKTLVSITEANQNFSKVARLVDENGIAVVMKNNVPRYVIIEFSQIEQEEIAAQEDVMTLSNRFINKNREAYKALAK